jgi:hypothetical protein
MKRATAENIVNAVKNLDEPIHRLALSVLEIEDETERKRIIQFIASVIADIHGQITRSVLKKHPDLDPDFPNEPHRWVKGDGEK